MAPIVTAAVLAVFLLSGCGSSSSVSSTSSTVQHTVKPTSHPPLASHHHAPRIKLPSIGRTLRVHAPGTVLSVTIQSLTDPLRNSGAALLPGNHAVGVAAEIVNDGPGDYDSSSTGDFSVVPSSGTAMPVFARSGQCQTPLRDWDNEISPGEARNGCVAFSVPSSARVLAVRFSPDGQPTGRVSWAG
jgi:hypothetical protein